MRTCLAALIVASTAGASCAPAAHYHLRLSASDPAMSRMCELTAADGAAPQDESCEPLGGQRLRAPGQVTVTVEGATSGAEYALNIEEQLPASGAASPDAVIDQVLGRLGLIARQTTTGLLNGAAGADETRTAERAQLIDLANKLGGTLGSAVRARVATAVGAAPEPVSVTVMAQVDEGETVVDVLARRPAFDNNTEPGIMRAASYTVSDIGELEVQGATAAQIADALTGQCGDASWGNVGGVPMVTYLATSPPNARAVLAALGLNAGTATAIVRGDRPPGIDERIRSLLARRREASPPAEVKAIERLFVEARLHGLAAACAHNTEIALGGGLTLLRPDVQTALTETLRQASALEQRTRGASTLYAQIIAPLITTTAATFLRGVASEGRVELGTFALHAGRLSLSLTETISDSTVTLAQTELEVASDTWLAVSVGPIVSFCAECFVTVSEVDRPATTTRAAGRAIAESSNDATFNAAVAVHASPFVLGDHRIGFMLGYPLTELNGSSASVLFGVGWGFAPAGLYLSVGAHVFMRSHIRGGGDVDLTLSGNEALRVSDVTESEPSIAGFMMLSLSSDLIFSLAHL